LADDATEIVRSWYTATAGRIDAEALDFWYHTVWHPDVDWRAVAGAPDDSGVMYGRDRLRAYMQELQEAFDDIVVEPLEVTEVGEYVVADVRFRGRSRGAGVPVELRFSVTFRLRGGKVVSGREYLTHGEAIAAASLQPS
jgi:ketosteroid isomerase-like protein